MTTGPAVWMPPATSAVETRPAVLAAAPGAASRLVRVLGQHSSATGWSRWVTRGDAQVGYRDGMTTNPYDPGDDPVAPEPLAPDELDDQNPDVAEPEPGSEES